VKTGISIHNHIQQLKMVLKITNHSQGHYIVIPFIMHGTCALPFAKKIYCLLKSCIYIFKSKLIEMISHFSL